MKFGVQSSKVVRRKKFKIALLSDQPFMEQISSKYLLPSVSSNRYLAKFLLATFNWSSTYSSHMVHWSGEMLFQVPVFGLGRIFKKIVDAP